MKRFSPRDIELVALYELDDDVLAPLLYEFSNDPVSRWQFSMKLTLEQTVNQC